MSQDGIEIIAEFYNRAKTTTSHQKASTSTPVQSDDEEHSSQNSPQITLSQDVSRRLNKFISSPTKTPSKKASPALTKYSPFKKNSPTNKTTIKPITSYFKKTPEKSSANSLSQVLQSVKKVNEPGKTDKEVFESLLSDGFDLSSVEIDEELLTPSKAAKVPDEPVRSTLISDEPTTLTPDNPKENFPREANNVPEENDDIFKSKKVKKKIKKALFPAETQLNKTSKNLSMSGPLDISSRTDFKFEDPSDFSEIELSQTSDDRESSDNKHKVLDQSSTQSEGMSQDPIARNSFSSSQSDSSESLAYADSYSACIEAALSDCLTYLKANKERGIFVDLNELEKFTANGSLHQTRRRLYARLLINRQFKWYRVKDLSSYEAALNLTHEHLVAELNHLEQEGFITSNLDEVDLASMLNLLQKKDLKQLCKFTRLNDNKTKPELIKDLVNYDKNQSVINFFTKTKDCTSKRTSILVKRTKEFLGHCIKLCEGPRNAFFQCLVFATYPHFSGDPSTRLKDYLERLIKVQRNEISFPPYTVRKTVVFPFERSFAMYQEALELRETVFNALNSDKKNIDWEKVAEFGQVAFDKFMEVLEDAEATNHVKSLPRFLHRFTAGHIHARTLFSILRENKKGSDKKFVIKALKLLLNQSRYLNQKRGAFYEELALIYQNHLKNNVKALEIVLRGLKDSETDFPMKHTLSLRGSMLSRRKTNPVPNELKVDVERYLVCIPDPTSVTIKARCLDGKSGYKQIYVTETDDGIEFSSVEEVAKSYYKKFGFTQVLHDEGSTLRSVIFACFWDIIYQQPSTLVEHSVFHSPFQSHPLDWGSLDFFHNRKTEIMARLKEMEDGDVPFVTELLTKVCEESENVESVINWSYLSKTRLNLLKVMLFPIYEEDWSGDFITALSVKVFCRLCLHLLQNVRLYGKAFPDLTMWNPVSTKCMFVEVKSPNDRLSNDQKLWLHNLSKMGANAEVCHIQATGSRKRKLVDEAASSSSVAT